MAGLASPLATIHLLLKALTLRVNTSLHDMIHMRISFINKKLAKILCNEKEIVRTYGTDNGRRIGLRLKQIDDADNLVELSKLPQTRVHELSGDRNEQISVDVKHPYRLLLRSDHDETPRKADGGLDWNRITKVVVLDITDTH